MSRAAIYCRISTIGKGQDASNQAVILREYCARHGYEIAGEYIDQASGSKADRVEFLRMFEDARIRKFDVIVFWALDRFSREGVLRTLEYLRQLDGYAVAWKSYTEPYFDSTGPMRELLIALFAWVAKQERDRLRDRVLAGLDTARRNGKRLGPPNKIFDRDAVRIHYRESGSVRKTALAFGLSKDTVARVVNERD